MVSMLPMTIGLAGAQTPVARQVNFHVDDPRPVQAAIKELSMRYGSLITYEDPAYVFADDVQDVTALYRKSTPGSAAATQPRIIVVAGRSLDVQFPVAGPNMRPESIPAVVAQILAAHEKSWHGGRFRAVENGGIIHVIPMQVRNERGMYTEVVPLLDTRIDLADQERTAIATLEVIADQLRKKTGTNVEVMTGPINLLAQKVRVAAADAPARDVLQATARQMHERLVWYSLYGPGQKQFGLNLRLVPDPNPPAPTKLKRPQPSDPTIPRTNMPPRARPPKK